MTQEQERNAEIMLARIEAIADAFGWKKIDIQPLIYMVSFSKDSRRINVYYSRRLLTVATVITHPTKGRGQLFRRSVTLKALKSIFLNPRVHTGIGYYTK